MGKGILAGASGGGTNIPVTSDPADNVQIWIDPNEEDQNEQFYTKKEILNDSTKAELGLDASATPNDAFLKLLASSSGYGSGLGNEYVWRRQKLAREFKEGTTTTNTARAFTSVAYKNITYSEDPVALLEGAATTLDTSSITTLQQLLTAVQSALPGKFVKTNYTGALMYFPDNVVFSINSDHIIANPGIDHNGYGIVTVVKEETYLNSPDPNAYPPIVDDGYTYTSLGKLGDKSRIATGSYVGTGKYGSANQNSLTFETLPKILYVYDFTAGNIYFIAAQGQTQPTIIAPGSSNAIKMTWGGNTVSWYSDNAPANQLNHSGRTYNYYAIG